MSKTNFRFSTNILNRLGEELNPDLTQGLLELVKNAYDADAHYCIVELNNVLNLSKTQHSLFKSKITIKDNGNGMNANDIIDSWLLLGKSRKNINQKTSLGRTPVGDKGLGRLAALRLGAKTTLRTISRDNLTVRYSLEINWADYDNAQAVEDIVLEIKEETFNSIQVSGTEIIIEQINRTIHETEIRKFARALILLSNPFEDRLSFKASLISNELTDIPQLIEQRYFHEAEFHLIAETIDGFVSVSIVDYQGNILAQVQHDEINKNHVRYQIPNNRLELWVFDFDNEIFSARASIKTDVKQWLNEFGGIHLYYNGLRVSPYGDKQEQWLGYNLRQLSNGQKGNSNLIGRLFVSDNNGLLHQTTDRHGFIENEAFITLKQLTNEVLNWLAKRWQVQQRNKTESIKEKLSIEAKESKNKLGDAIKNITNPKEKKEIKKAYESRERYFSEREKQYQKELQLYRTLSTTGITAAVFAHESNSNPLKVISGAINTIERRTKEQFSDLNLYNNKIKDSVELIKKSTGSLQMLSNVSLSLVNHEKRKRIILNVHECILDTIALFDSFTKGRDTVVKPEFVDEKVRVYGSQAALESIMINLLNNSLTAFENKEVEQRIILIRTEIISDAKAESGRAIIIRVLDNGTGICGIAVKDIWLAGETTTKNGTGLGLKIVYDTVTDMKGRVDAIAQTDELGGAEIIIILPLVS